MIARVARSIRKRASRLLGTPIRPEETFRRRTIARAYLSGNGIEIGALHNPLKMPRAAHVLYVDRLGAADLRREYPELSGEVLVDVDIIDDGESLSNMGDATQDFVVANHFIEHCENPIEAVRNMLRVLKEGGVLYLAVPDKRFTFDKDRPVTPIEHLMRDFREGPAWSRRRHYEEWTRLVDKVKDETDATRHAQGLMERRTAIHFHVWTQGELLDLMSALRRMWPFDIELMFKRDNEVIFILRKAKAPFHA